MAPPDISRGWIGNYVSLSIPFTFRSQYLLLIESHCNQDQQQKSVRGGRKQAFSIFCHH
jgi:hypothetical protein